MQCRSHIIGAPWVLFYILSSTCLLEDQRPDEKGGEEYRLDTCLRFEYVCAVLGMADSDRFDLVQAKSGSSDGYADREKMSM